MYSRRTPQAALFATHFQLILDQQVRKPDFPDVAKKSPLVLRHLRHLRHQNSTPRFQWRLGTSRRNASVLEPLALRALSRLKGCEFCRVRAALPRQDHNLRRHFASGVCGSSPIEAGALESSAVPALDRIWQHQQGPACRCCFAHSGFCHVSVFLRRRVRGARAEGVSHTEHRSATYLTVPLLRTGQSRACWHALCIYDVSHAMFVWHALRPLLYLYLVL